jgi:hypothetical protein
MWKCWEEIYAYTSCVLNMDGRKLGLVGRWKRERETHTHTHTKTTIWNGGVHKDDVKVGMGHERGIFKFLKFEMVMSTRRVSNGPTPSPSSLIQRMWPHKAWKRGTLNKDLPYTCIITLFFSIHPNSPSYYGHVKISSLLLV